MTAARLLRHCLWASMLMAWLPTTIWASVIVAQQGSKVLQLDTELVVFSIVLATLAGMATLAIRVNALFAAEPEKPLTRAWLFSAAHILGSYCGGTAAFLAGRAQGLEVWTALLGVFLLSFMGAKGVEMMVEKWMPIYRPKEPA